MKADRQRVPGFYWVRFEGEAIVAEFTHGLGCSEETPHWHVPGAETCFQNKEICELLSGRLDIPAGATLDGREHREFPEGR